MNFKNLYQNTLIPEIPTIINNNFVVVQNYLDLIYNSSMGAIIVPVNTSGKIQGAQGQFSTIVVDNLVVKNQYTNLYGNSNSADSDYVNCYISSDSSYRDASIGMWEDIRFKYIDVQTTYYKIRNDVSYGFNSQTVGQIIQFLFDASAETRFNIKLDPSTEIYISAADSSMAWMKLICYKIDPSKGSFWINREWGGNFIKKNI